MNIGILGGSFDPPHLGHILIAQQTVEFGLVDHVWFLPCFTHTFDKQLSTVSDRLAMTRLLSAPHTSVSTLEIDHQLDGNTINLIPLLKNKYPNDMFTFIIGSDQLATFTRWGSWEKLLQAMPFLIVPRAGYQPHPLHTNMQLLAHPLHIETNISSTNIRKRVHEGFSISHLVPDTIMRYIAERKLYAKL